MKRYGIIYKITNNLNGKVYIGQTTNNFYKRYSNNICKNTHSDYLRNDIIKLGIENFTVEEEIDIAYSKDELHKKELMYISKFKSFEKEFGYNIMTGWLGGCHSLETKQKISKNQIGKNKYGDNQMSRKVVCLNNGEVYESISLVVKRFGNKFKHICENCCGIIKSCGTDILGNKLVWAYYEDYIQMSIEQIKNKILNSEEIKKFKGNNIKVICLNNGIVYEGINEAGRVTGVYKQNIIACCKGKVKSAGKDLKTGEKLMWKYY